MPMQHNKILEFNPSIFSKISINGRVTFEDILIIEGDFNGNIEGKDKSILTISKGSSVEGSVHAYEVNVEGFFKGKIFAQIVHIHPNGSCNGEITCSQLTVHDNAKMDSKIQTVWNVFTKVLN